MEKLNFKNYPAKLLIGSTLVLAIIINAIKEIYSNRFLDLQTIIWPTSYIGIISLIYWALNKYAMFGWYLKILNLTDIRGHYKGYLISSYHEDDDPTKPNIKMKMEMEISQNINGIKIFGKVSPIGSKEGKTSDFESEWAELRKLENGDFILEYRYANRSNKSHSWDKKYILTSHTGWAYLTYKPKLKSMEGFYTTYENKSNGKLELTLNK